MPPKAQPNSAPLGLTTREIEIAVIAWKCLEADNKIDTAKLATLANIGKAESAGRMWRTIRGKIEATPATDTSNGAGRAAQATVTATKKKAATGGKKRTKKAADTDDRADADADEHEDVAKPKKAAKRAKVAKSEAAVDSKGMGDNPDAGKV